MSATTLAPLFGLIALLFFILYLLAQARVSRLRQQLTDREKAHRRELDLRGTLQEQLRGQITAMEDRFTTLSESITKRRTEELTASTSTTLAGIVQPLRDSLREVRQTLADTTEKETDRAARLEETILRLTKQSQEVGHKADALADALRRKPKLQGNWGEVQLETLLEREGFEKGVHFDTQQSLRTESNTLLRPDFILHFPDDRDVVIDAKVSLTAYVEYIEAPDDAERTAALDRHIASLRSHIRELRDKRYQSHIAPPRRALDYVLMYVPTAPALQLAYERAPGLWDEAIRARVLMTSDLNLLVLLRIIELTWKHDAQVKNFSELTKQAGYFLERAERFTTRFESIQTRINALQSAYTETDTALRGQQGLLGPATRIRDLSTSADPTDQV